MKLLTGYLAPTSGTARIAGIDVASDRIRAAEKIGYLPENGPLYPEMTPRRPARVLRRSARPDRPADGRAPGRGLTEECSLRDVLDKPIGKLSRGYRQRVGMAHVLLHDPEILIMDEPTTGLDPNQIRHVRDNIRRLGETRTILLSTHLFQEVDAVAGRALMVNNGRLVFDGTPAELRTRGGGDLEEAFHTLTEAS